MQSSYKIRITVLITIFSIFAVTNTKKADSASPPRLWQRPISYVYVCSDNERVSAKSLDAFYTEVAKISAQFHDDWIETNDNKTHFGIFVIVAISSKEISSDLADCLKRIPLFQMQWLEGMNKQAGEIGTVPAYLANLPLGDYYEPLTASWTYSYNDSAVLSSYIYQDIEHFSYEDAVRGALQFQGSSEVDIRNSEDD